MYNWNHAFLRYCDGGYYSGQRDEPKMIQKNPIFYRGRGQADPGPARDVKIGGRSRFVSSTSGTLSCLIWYGSTRCVWLLRSYQLDGWNLLLRYTKQKCVEHVPTRPLKTVLASSNLTVVQADSLDSETAVLWCSMFFSPKKSFLKVLMTVPLANSSFVDSQFRM